MKFATASIIALAAAVSHAQAYGDAYYDYAALVAREAGPVKYTIKKDPSGIKLGPHDIHKREALKQGKTAANPESKNSQRKAHKAGVKAELAEQKMRGGGSSSMLGGKLSNQAAQAAQWEKEKNPAKMNKALKAGAKTYQGKMEEIASGMKEIKLRRRYLDDDDDLLFDIYARDPEAEDYYYF